MADEVEKLKAALRWVLDNQATYYSSKLSPGRWYDSGCGCCSGTIECPPEIAETLKEFV